MIPVQTDATTVVLGPPKGWDAKRDGECISLPIVREGEEMHSFWQLGDEERAAIAGGGMIRLTVFSVAHPPVMVAATAPGLPAEVVDGGEVP